MIETCISSCSLVLLRLRALAPRSGHAFEMGIERQHFKVVYSIGHKNVCRARLVLILEWEDRDLPLLGWLLILMLLLA